MESTWLNYHHLYYFYVIAHEGSIARASKKLRVGQPTLSAQLKQLENNLDKALFERRNRSLVLTDSGRLVLEYAKNIFQLGNEMVEAVHDRLTATRVHLQIGVLDTVPKSFVHKLVTSAYEVGDCYVTVLEGGGDRLLRDLMQHRLDLIVTNGSLPTRMSGFHSRLVQEMGVIICGAPQYDKLRAGFPGSLKDQPFFMPTGHSKLRQDVETFLDLNGLKVKPLGEAQDSEVQKRLARSGHALIPISEPAVQEAIIEGSLIEIGRLPGLKEELWISTANRKVENPIAAELMRSFKVN